MAVGIRGFAWAPRIPPAYSAGSMSRKSEILPLAAPLVVSFWLRAAFAWADAAFAATLPQGDAALAAIGLTMPFEFLMIACWVGTSNGLTARLSAAMGAGEGQKISQLLRATRRIVLALCAGFLGLALFLWVRADLFSKDPAVVEALRVYGSVLLAGSAFTSFWSILPDSIVKAHHDTRSTMWAGLLSSVLNLALNALFVFVFHWGIFGIALSTVIGRLAGFVYAQRRANHHEAVRKASGADNQPGRFEHPVRSVLAIAVPAGTTFVLMSLELLVVNALLERQADGTAALAAFSIYDRCLRFLSMPIIACGVATLPLAARLWGRGDIGGIRSELAVVRRASLVYAVLVLLPLALWLGPWVASALADSEAAREGARAGMLWVPVAVLVAAPMLVSRSAMEGMQRPRPGMLAAGLRSLAFVLPLTVLSLWLAPQLGYDVIHGAYAGTTAGSALASILMSRWTRSALLQAQEQARSATPGPAPA